MRTDRAALRLAVIPGILYPWRQQVMFGDGPGMLLNISQCPGSPSPAKDHPYPQATGAEMEKQICLRICQLSEVLTASGAKCSSSGPRRALEFLLHPSTVCSRLSVSDSRGKGPTGLIRT